MSEITAKLSIINKSELTDRKAAHPKHQNSINFFITIID